MYEKEELNVYNDLLIYEDKLYLQLLDLIDEY